MLLTLGLVSILICEQDEQMFFLCLLAPITQMLMLIYGDEVCVLFPFSFLFLQFFEPPTSNSFSCRFNKMISQNRPKVIIVGAGLGGVTLGLLLEHAGISYNIFEQATVLKPLGIAGCIHRRYHSCRSRGTCATQSAE